MEGYGNISWKTDSLTELMDGNEKAKQETLCLNVTLLAASTEILRDFLNVFDSSFLPISMRLW